MPTDIKDIFRRVIDELDEEEQKELLTQLKDKKLTGKEIADAIRELPEDERASIRDAFLSVTESSNPDKQTKSEASKLEDEKEKEEEEGVPAADEKEKKKGKTRPGRKNGRAYGWYVDEKGRVKVSDVASVYSGEDEPDEVELYPDDEEEEEESEEDV